MTEYQICKENLSVQDRAKVLAAEMAVERFVQDGMKIGLGSGSTAHFFVRVIGEKIHRGLNITAVTTSVATKRIADQCKIPITDLNKIAKLDLLVDGTDEIDGQFRMIKGGGASLLWEKIVAHASKKMIIICDQTKIVDKLGKFPLPIEVVQFGWRHTQRQIKQILQKFTIINPKIIRRQKNSIPFITDNFNYILDCHCQEIDRPLEVAKQLQSIPGVVEHGLFNFEADGMIVGMFDATLKIEMRKRD